MQVMEGDIIRTIRDQHPYFAHYHTAGNPGRNEIDATQELNYPAIMRAILETGYEGYVGQEFVPKGDVLEALKSAFEICNVSLWWASAPPSAPVATIRSSLGVKPHDHDHGASPLYGAAYQPHCLKCTIVLPTFVIRSCCGALARSPAPLRYA